MVEHPVGVLETTRKGWGNPGEIYGRASRWCIRKKWGIPVEN